MPNTTAPAKLVHKFVPNAFLCIRNQRPLLLFFPLPYVQGNIAVSSFGLNWNSTKNRAQRGDYVALTEHLLESLPKERKYKGGFFRSQVHYGRLAPWQINEGNSAARIIYLTSRKPDDICIRDCRITVGEYAGNDYRAAILSTFGKPKR